MRTATLLAMAVAALAGCNQSAPQDSASDPARLAEIAVEAYQQADSDGKAGQKCVKAREASAAYKAADDQADYTIWRAIQEADCTSVGLPVD
jgi:hypothetical protein